MENKRIVFGGVKYHATNTDEIKTLCQKTINCIEQKDFFNLNQSIEELKNELSLFHQSVRPLTHEELKNL